MMVCVNKVRAKIVAVKMKIIDMKMAYVNHSVNSV